MLLSLSFNSNAFINKIKLSAQKILHKSNCSWGYYSFVYKELQ